jgi:hypothetical protein
VGAGGGMMNRFSSALTTMAALSLLKENTKSDPVLINQYPAERPWHNYHVPKALRKGKSPGEIDALRKELWKQSKPEEE